MSSKQSQKIVQKSRSNFAGSFFFLPKEKRAALETIYAWCRLTDDIVDEIASPQEAQAALDSWRQETKAALQQQSVSDPILIEIAQVAKTYQIPQQYFLDLIAGCQMDLNKNTYATFDELYLYCYRVASVVGLMCLEVFGYTQSIAKVYAEALGMAFQLTNILRDIKNDADLGRVYIPEEDLKRFHLTRADILLASDRAANRVEFVNQFKALIQFEAQRADSYYRKAKSLLPAADKKNLVAAEAMRSIYWQILRRIRSSPMSVLNQKLRLSAPEKALRMTVAWIKSL